MAKKYKTLTEQWAAEDAAKAAKKAAKSPASKSSGKSPARKGIEAMKGRKNDLDRALREAGAKGPSRSSKKRYA